MTRYAGFGLRDGDVLEMVNFKSPQRLDELRAALVESKTLGSLSLAVTRNGQSLLLMYFADDQTARTEALVRANPLHREDRSPATSGAASLEPAEPLPEIRALGHDHYEMKREQYDRFFENTAALSSMVRLVPSIRDGKPDGFRVYAIRAGSIPGRLGLKNGDTIRTIDGENVSTPDVAIAAYVGLRKATEVRVGIVRRDEPIELVWLIR